MLFKENNVNVINKDILPLFFQLQRQILNLKLKIEELTKRNEEILIENDDLKSKSFLVKSYCVNCENINNSINESDFDSDSLIFKKIFEKNLSHIENKETNFVTRNVNDLTNPYVKFIFLYTLCYK